MGVEYVPEPLKMEGLYWLAVEWLGGCNCELEYAPESLKMRLSVICGNSKSDNSGEKLEWD